VRKHITLRNIIDNTTEEDAIDQTIERALTQLSQQSGVAMDLVSASTFYRRDGLGFVTVVAEQSADAPPSTEPAKSVASINWTVEEGQNVVDAQPSANVGEAQQ
jgi:hypothetical protein